MKHFSLNKMNLKLFGGLLAGALLFFACKSSTASDSAAPRADALDTLLSEHSYAKIKPGNFLMGSHETEPTDNPLELRMRPQHRVLISKPFELGKYEVTQAQWEAVMGQNPSQFKGANLPVENVSWQDVQEFIARLQPLDDKYIYRLPTEAEWEYACRAGSTGDFSGQSLEDLWRREEEFERRQARAQGKTPRAKSSKEREREREREAKPALPKKPSESTRPSLQEQLAEFAAEAKHEEFLNSDIYLEPLLKQGWFFGPAQGRTHPVGQKQPNAWGLYDMHGNVMEWCQDWFDPQYYASSPATDPPGQSSSTWRSIRGCSWQSPARLCQVALRGFDVPTHRLHTTGFRLVRVAK